MVKNYLRSSFRALKRQSVYAFVNLFGLTAGLAVSILLFVFIKHELSFDEFHAQSDRIHRVVSHYTTNKGGVGQTAISFGTLAPAINSEIPEIEETVRVLRGGNVDVRYNNNNFLGKRLLFTEYSFFQIFSFKSLLASGFSKTSFESGGLVMSHQTALELFGKVPQEPVELTINGKQYPLLDIVEVPKTSHLQFDILLAGKTDPDWDDLVQYSGLEFWTYILYHEGANVENANRKVKQVYDKQMSDRFNDFVAEVDNWVQPLAEVHLYSEDITTSPQRGSIQTLKTLIVIDILILLIVVFNFINLSTATYEKRIKEIGIRKVLGAFRGNLIAQFLTESVMLTVLGFTLAIFAAELLVRPFGNMLNISADIPYWSDPLLLVFMLSAAILLGVLAGLYPALFISSFSPNRILKRQVFSARGKNIATSITVGLQFVIAIVLLTNLGYFKAQIGFMKDKNPGFNQEHVVVINNVNDKLKGQLKTIETELSQIPNLKQLSAAQSVPGAGTSGQTIYLDGQNANTAIPISEIRTQFGFLKTFEIPLVAGRDFDINLESDKKGFILNEAAINSLFPEGGDPISKIVKVGNRKGPILGVMKDYHNRSLKYKISPLMITLDPPYRLMLALKINPEGMDKTLSQVEEVLTAIDPSYSMSYSFLDEDLANQYRSEERSTAIISWSSLLAAILSLIGLLALTSFSIAKRTKEVAIRKVLGARILSLNWTLIKGLGLILVVSNLIANPIAWWTSQQWLTGYAYQIGNGQSWFIVPLVVLTSLTIPLILISIEVIKKAKQSPVDVLRSE